MRLMRAKSRVQDQATKLGCVYRLRMAAIKLRVHACRERDTNWIMRVDTNDARFVSDEAIDLIGIADDDVVRRELLQQQRFYNAKAVRHVFGLAVGPRLVLPRDVGRHVVRKAGEARRQG